MARPKVRWDQGKAIANKRKHGIGFLEATEALLDPLAATVEDEVHSTPDERRVAIVGMSLRGRLLRVTVTQRGSTIRLISARRATARERYDYEEG